MSDWVEKKLGDILTLQRGHDLPTQERANGDVPIIGSAGLTGYHNESKATGPGVIVGRSGNSMGEVHFVSKDYWPLNTALYVKDFKGNDERFIYCLLKTINFDQFNSGSAQKSLNRNAVHPFVVKIPESVEEQKQIAKALFDLGDKIELNRQTNQTLEQIAQAIFKSWFVDFEPVKAKIIARGKGGNELAQSLAAQAILCGAITLDQLQDMESGYQGLEATLHPLIADRFPDQQGLDYWTPETLQSLADAFPSELVDSHLGEIPNGWEVSTFGEVSTCFDSIRVPLSKRQREEKQGSIPYYGATSVMGYVDDYLFDDILLLIGEDGSVLHEDGTPFTQYIWGRSWINNHAHVLRGKNGISTEQLMIFIKSKNIAAYVTGAVQLKLNQKNMNSIPFIKATDEVNFIFQTLIEPLYGKYRQGVEEIGNLSSIRDSLLPKLLSGEISINQQLRNEGAVA